MPEMTSIRQKWLALGRVPAVRTGLFVLGLVLIAAAPVVGIFPGPGGIIVFAAGMGLVLKYSEWAKRKYVAFKRRHPNKGAWADWGMRRRSALRRQSLDKARREAEEPTLARGSLEGPGEASKQPLRD